MPFFLGRRRMLECTKKANRATQETCPITLSLARETKPSAAAMWLSDFLKSSEGRGYETIAGPGQPGCSGFGAVSCHWAHSPPLPCSGPGSENYSWLPCTSRQQSPLHVSSRARKGARIQRPMGPENGFLAEYRHSLNYTQPWSMTGCTRLQARLRADTCPCSFFLRAFQLAQGCHSCPLGEPLPFPKASMELSPSIRKKEPFQATSHHGSEHESYFSSDTWLTGTLQCLSHRGRMT